VFSKDSIVISNTINYTGWKIINIVSLEKIYSKIIILNNIAIIILVSIIVLIIFSSLILSKTLTKPIEELIKKIQKVGIERKIYIQRGVEEKELEAYEVILTETGRLVIKDFHGLRPDKG
jgi:two-component system sensor histidine kinase YesM